jgi:Predicted HD superfamily hydrolase
MNLDYNEMLDFVYETLKMNKGLKSDKPHLFFRNRYEHIQRVFGWANRILPGVETCNVDVVLTAAVFHDVGYKDSIGKNHAALGSQIFETYALDHDFDLEFTKKVSNLIQQHSYKELLHHSDTSIELILLMEADLLDEEGALGIVFDLLAEGYKEPESYASVFNEIMIHSAHIVEQNYMITPLAKKFWEEKKRFIENFMKDLKFDLFME